MRFAGAKHKDIDRWVSKGLIDQSTANRLIAELDEAGGGFGLGGVLAIFGALLLGAAVITIVAANWEGIPRLARVAAILALIWATWLGGAWRDKAGDRIFSQVLYLIGALCFGAGIALVGQMYHLSGDTASAALVWAVVAMLNAALLRAPIVSATSAGVGILYLTAALTDNSWHEHWFIIIAPALAAAIFILSHWTGSRVGKHGAVWLLVGSVISFRFLNFFDDVNTLDYLFAFGGAALFVIVAFTEDAIDRVTGFSHAILGYSLGLSFFGFTLLQLFYGIDNSETALFGLIVLALSVGALLLKGRDHGGVRALAYTAFGTEILYLASVTIGSLIGTSAFFLMSGIIVMAIAWLMIRIEKRLKAQPREGAAS